MSEEVADTSQWLDQNRSSFQQASELAAQIGEQNQLYAELVESGQLTMQPFQELTEEYLTASQGETFGELVEAQAAAPYEELVEREKQLATSRGGLRLS